MYCQEKKATLSDNQFHKAIGSPFLPLRKSENSSEIDHNPICTILHMILDTQYILIISSSFPSTGNVKPKTDPSPGVDFTQIDPLCLFMI